MRFFFQMVWTMTQANQITAYNAGWSSKLRFADGVFWSGACEFFR